MLYTIAAMLLVLWLLGLVTSYTLRFLGYRHIYDSCETYPWGKPNRVAFSLYP